MSYPQMYTIKLELLIISVVIEINKGVLNEYI